MLETKIVLNRPLAALAQGAKGAKGNFPAAGFTAAEKLASASRLISDHRCRRARAFPRRLTRRGKSCLGDLGVLAVNKKSSKALKRQAKKVPENMFHNRLIF